MKKNILILILLAIATTASLGQDHVFRGNVYAFKDVYLKNITVEAKKAKTKAITDSLGNFSIVCDKYDRLVFRGKGFRTTVIKTNGEATKRVKMIFVQGKKNEEVAVGFGHISKKDLTDGVAHYSSFNNDFTNYLDIFTLIQNKFPGVQIQTFEDGTKHLVIRGINSLHFSVFPLYIVDGVMVSDISHITPFMVQDVDVLKDSATAMYGSRGANGVIIISTRRNYQEQY